MVLGALSSLGRLGTRVFGRLGSRLSGRLGSGFKYSRLGASRASLLSSRASRAGIGGIGRSKSGLSKLSWSSIKSKLKKGGSRFLTKTRQGLKGAWRKIEVDPIGSATSAYAATRNPNVTLTIDGLDKPVTGSISNPYNLQNFASFSSW